MTRRQNSAIETAIRQDRRRLIQAVTEKVYASELGARFTEFEKQLSDLCDQQARLAERLMEQGLDDAGRWEIVNRYDELLHRHSSLSKQCSKLSASVRAEITAEMQRQLRSLR